MTYTRSLEIAAIADEQNWKASETEKSNLNAGIEVSAKRKNWRITTGLGTLKLQESTNYSTQLTTTEYLYAKKIVNNEYTTTPRGTRVVLLADVKVDSTTSTTSQNDCPTCEIELNYVNIPLTLQYEVGKKRLRYFAEGGINTLINTRNSGQYATLNESNQTWTISDLQSSSAVNNVLLLANASVGANYCLSSSWELWTSYSHRIGLGSVFATYEHKPSWRGVRAGVSYKIR
jgi:hypothetical protein